MAEKIVIQQAIEFGDSARIELADIFIEGFYQWLKFFSKDKEKLKKAFEHIFQLEVFYVAVVDGHLAGFAACADEKHPSVRLDSPSLRKHLGWYRGTIAGIFLKREFEKKPYPFHVTKEMGLIEFVATSPNFRKQGIASTIIEKIFSETAYQEYVLEVADTNTNAVNLYKKLGFQTFMSVPQKHSKHSGVNELVYMRFKK